MSEAQLTIFEANELAGELTEKLNSLLDKYIEIRGVQLLETKATWEAVEVATGYEITFTDLGKKFTVSTNEFVYADYGIPTDTKYNVQINVITGEVEGYITMGEAITQFGTPSDLPKVQTPIINFEQAAFTWTANQYEGATAVRVYVDGVLLREVPIIDGQYLYGSNGVTSITSKEDWKDTTQIGAVVVDHSFFSGLIEVKYELTNVALLKNGSIIETYNEFIQDIYRIIDGKDNTQWQALPAGTSKPYMDNMSFIIKLDNVYTVYGFRLYWQNAKALKYDIEYSLNGIDWFTASEFRLDSGTSGNRDDYLYLDTPIQAQFIRFQGIEIFNQYGYNLYAFEVYSMM